MGKNIIVGVRAGLIGGLLMAVFAMIFIGVDQSAGAGLVALGAVLHLLTAALLGVVFTGFLARGRRGVPAVLSGIAYGCAVFVLMTFVVLPVVDSALVSRVAVMPGVWLAAHVLFGLGVGSVQALHRQSIDATDDPALSSGSMEADRRLPAW